MVADRSTEDSILGVTPRYPHIMNYMAPPNSFHDPSSLAYSGPQPGLDHSTQIRSEKLASTSSIPVTVNQSAPELSSDDEQGTLVPETITKPKRSKQQPTPATKTGGKSRTKVDSSTKPKVAKGGRSQGSRNFQSLETGKLLSIIAKLLPIGGNSWQAVAKEYNEWSAKHQFKERDKKSLKQKFDMVRHLA